MQAALLGVGGHGLGQPVGGQGCQRLQAGVEQQRVQLVVYQAFAQGRHFLVGAHGGHRHGRVLRLGHALVGRAPMQHGQRAHEFDGRLGVLRRQGADGRVEQLVHPAGRKGRDERIGQGADGIGQHGIVAELRVQERLHHGRVYGVHGAVDLVNGVHLHDGLGFPR